MSQAVRLTVDEGLAILRLGRDHGNAINGEVVDGLLAGCRQAEADGSVRGMLLASSGKLFCPGLDLQELHLLDRAGMEHFMRRFGAAVLALYEFSKPLVAAIHGHAVAGGCVLSLTADWRVLCRGAKIGLNEIKVGVPLPFGVAMILRETVPRARLEEVALFGRNYTDDEAVAVGLAHEVRPETDFESYCLERLSELASRDARAFVNTKRYLRSATVERVRSHDPHFAAAFLDAWFSPTTQERIRSLVDQLRGK